MLTFLFNVLIYIIAGVSIVVHFWMGFPKKELKERSK